MDNNRKLKTGHYRVTSLQAKHKCVNCKHFKKDPEWLLGECMHEDYSVEDEKCIYLPTVEPCCVCDKHEKNKKMPHA